MDKALLVDISYTEEPYAVRIDPAQLAKQPDGTYHIAGGSPGAHASSHAAAGSDPVTLSMSQVSGLSAAIAPLGTSTSAATPSTLALRDAAGAAEFAGLSVDTTPTVVQTGAPGKLIWNETAGTLEFQLKGGNVTLQLGQEQVLRVRNAEATTLVDGEVVYLSGSTGVHNTAWRASNLTEAASARTIGVVTEHIAAGADGYVTTFGMVRGLDTNHLTEGALVYLGTAGATTVTAAVPPAHNVVVGYCVKKSGGNGAIFVHVQNGFELHELHDVLLGAQAEGDTLAWDNVTKVWRNKVPSTQPWALKTGDNFSGAVGVTAPTGTALTVTSTNGVGELALKIRTAAATSTSAQAGVDYGFNNLYRITQAVAGAGIGAPFGGAAYTYCSGVPYRFITDHVLKGIEFWAGFIYAARVYNGTVQCGAVPSGGSTTGIPLYCGKSAATVQLRVGDLAGNCWSIGRDNVSTGDLIIEPTAPAGTTPFASALRVSGATGVCRATFGQQIGASGTTITQTKVYTPTLTPASQGANALVEQTFTVAGLTTADTVYVNAPGAVAMSARVSAADTLALTFHAPSGGTYTAPAGVYRIVAIRS